MCVFISLVASTLISCLDECNYMYVSLASGLSRPNTKHLFCEHGDNALWINYMRPLNEVVVAVSSDARSTGPRCPFTGSSPYLNATLRGVICPTGPDNFRHLIANKSTPTVYPSASISATWGIIQVFLTTNRNIALAGFGFPRRQASLGFYRPSPHPSMAYTLPRSDPSIASLSNYIYRPISWRVTDYFPLNYL